MTGKHVQDGIIRRGRGRPRAGVDGVLTACLISSEIGRRIADLKAKGITRGAQERVIRAIMRQMKLSRRSIFRKLAEYSDHHRRVEAGARVDGRVWFAQFRVPKSLALTGMTSVLIPLSLEQLREWRRRLIIRNAKK